MRAVPRSKATAQSQHPVTCCTERNCDRTYPVGTIKSTLFSLTTLTSVLVTSISLKGGTLPVSTNPKVTSTRSVSASFFLSAWAGRYVHLLSTSLSTLGPAAISSRRARCTESASGVPDRGEKRDENGVAVGFGSGFKTSEAASNPFGGLRARKRAEGYSAAAKEQRQGLTDETHAARKTLLTLSVACATHWATRSKLL